MEHGEEIGSGQRDRPFGPLHGFGPHGLLRDFVTREAVEKQLRSLQRPSLGYKVERAVAGYGALVRHPPWVNLNFGHCRRGAR